MSFIPLPYAVGSIIKYIPQSKIIWCPFDEKWSAYYNRFTYDVISPDDKELEEIVKQFNLNLVIPS